jgi:hypothetical protein
MLSQELVRLPTRTNLADETIFICLRFAKKS